MTALDTELLHAVAVGELAAQAALNQVNRTRESVANRLVVKPSASGATWPDVWDEGPTFSGQHQPTWVGLSDPERPPRPSNHRLNYREPFDGMGYVRAAKISEIPNEAFVRLALVYEHGLFARGAVVDADMAVAIYTSLLREPPDAGVAKERVRIWLPAEITPRLKWPPFEHVYAGWAPLTGLATELGLPGPDDHRHSSHPRYAQAPGQPWRNVGPNFAFAGPALGNKLPSWFDASEYVPVFGKEGVFAARVPPPEAVLAPERARAVRALLEHATVAPLRTVFTTLLAAETWLGNPLKDAHRQNRARYLRAERNEALKWIRVHLRNISKICKGEAPMALDVTRPKKKVPRTRAKAAPKAEPGHAEVAVWTVWGGKPPPSEALFAAEPGNEDESEEPPEREVRLPSGAVVQARRNRMR